MAFRYCHFHSHLPKPKAWQPLAGRLSETRAILPVSIRRCSRPHCGLQQRSDRAVPPTGVMTFFGNMFRWCRLRLNHRLMAEMSLAFRPSIADVLMSILKTIGYCCRRRRPRVLTAAAITTLNKSDGDSSKEHGCPSRSWKLLLNAWDRRAPYHFTPHFPHPPPPPPPAPSHYPACDFPKTLSQEHPRDPSAALPREARQASLRGGGPRCLR